MMHDNRIIQMVSYSLVIALFVYSQTARADSLLVSRNQPVTEVSHHVKMLLKDGVVTYKVQRTFANSGTRSEQAMLDIYLPFGAAATGLRIKAADKWYDGELMEREEARRKYQELTGIGIADPKDPALLEWMWADRLRLFIFPVMAKKTSTVEYTLTVPTRYAGGGYSVTYPLNTNPSQMADPVLTVMNSTKDISVQVNKKIVAVGQPVVLTEKMVPRCIVGDTVEEVTCAISAIDVTDAQPTKVKTVTLSMDIRHTYKGDLRVELLSPVNEIYNIVSHEGGSENHIQLTKDIQVVETDGCGKWQLVVRDEAGLDVGSLEQWSLTFNKGKNERRYSSVDTPLFIPDLAGEDNGNQVTIELRSANPKRVAARLGRVVATKHKQFSKLDIELAKPFSNVPKSPHVVFLVDASFSMEIEGIEGQLAIVKSFLSHVPDAKVEIVLYRRYAELLFGDFVDGEAFIDTLEQFRATAKLAPHNGSALEEGFQRAVKLLGRKKGPAYIVGFTDELLRPAFQNKWAVSALSRTAPKTIVHLVKPESGSFATLTRDDENHLAPIPEIRGGIYAEFEYQRTDEGFAVKEMSDAALGLVRPVGIDYFKVTGAAYETLNEAMGYIESLEEGAGVRLFEQLSTAPSQVTLRGEIWSRPFKRTVQVSSLFSRATAGFVFSQDMDDDLTDREKLKVAFFGRAVSPVTSYLAIEPGVRPSIDGLTYGRLDASGFGRGAGSAGGAAMVRNSPPNFRRDVQHVIDSCSAEYSVEKQQYADAQHVTVHTTYQEIVDVIATHPENVYQHCVVEGIWKVVLSADDYYRRRNSFEISL